MSSICSKTSFITGKNYKAENEFIIFIIVLLLFAYLHELVIILLFSAKLALTMAFNYSRTSMARTAFGP